MSIHDRTGVHSRHHTMSYHSTSDQSRLSCMCLSRFMSPLVPHQSLQLISSYHMQYVDCPVRYHFYFLLISYLYLLLTFFSSLVLLIFDSMTFSALSLTLYTSILFPQLWHLCQSHSYSQTLSHFYRHIPLSLLLEMLASPAMTFRHPDFQTIDAEDSIQQLCLHLHR